MVSLATHPPPCRVVVDDAIAENDDYVNGDTVLATQSKMEESYTYNRCE